MVKKLHIFVFYNCILFYNYMKQGPVSFSLYGSSYTASVDLSFDEGTRQGEGSPGLVQHMLVQKYMIKRHFFLSPIFASLHA